MITPTTPTTPTRARPLRLLLVNPNTSTHITERLSASARAAMWPGETLTAVTATTGPAVVRTAEGLLQARHSALALALAHAPGHDGLLLGISLDGAAVALREQHPGLPVVGMTEAALMTACLRAERIGLLTLGAHLLPLYRQRVARIGLARRVVAYQAPEAPSAYGAGAAGVDADVLALLVAACQQLRQDGAQAVVLAGAVLCGYGPTLTARCGLPVFDGVACAVGQLRILGSNAPPATAAQAGEPLDVT
jgi:allantoin racemase